MGRRLTAVAWLERDYDETMRLERLPARDGKCHLRAAGAPDVADECRPMFSLKRDGFDGEPRWPDAAWWPTPHERDDLDDPVNWWEW